VCGNLTCITGNLSSEVKTHYDSIFSLHVYSVQAALPKDSAHLWTVDSEQRKELFNKPDNPLASNQYPHNPLNQDKFETLGLKLHSYCLCTIEMERH